MYIERSYNDGRGNFVSSSHGGLVRPGFLVHQVAKRSSVDHAFQHNIGKRGLQTVFDRSYNYKGNFVASSRTAMSRPDLQVHQLAKRSMISEEKQPFVPQHSIGKRSPLHKIERNYNDGNGNFVTSSRMIAMSMPNSNQIDQTLELELAAK